MFPFSAAYFLWTVLNNEGGKQRDIIGNKGPLQQIFEILLKACPCTVVINYFQKRYLRNLLPRFPRVFVSFYMRGAQLVKKNRPALQYRSLFNQMQIITYSVVGKWAHCETNTQRVNNDVVSNEAGIQNPKLPTIWMDFGFDVVKEWTNLRLSFGNDINVSNRKDNECEYDLNEGEKVLPGTKWSLWRLQVNLWERRKGNVTESQNKQACTHYPCWVSIPTQLYSSRCFDCVCVDPCELHAKV